MTPDKLRGSITALVTPFKDEAVDEESFRAHVNWQIENGTHGLVPVGTTGESPTLSHDEHRRVVEMCVEEARGRVPVIAGAGSNNTREAVELATHAEKSGADAVLVVTPYYNKPNQEGLFQHFKAINDAIGIPIIIYNIPPRSVVDMTIDTMKRLFELRNIVGVKDATGNVARVSTQRDQLGAEFIQLSGEDMTALAAMARAPRLHIGHVERRAAGLRRHARSVSVRRLCRCAAHPGSAGSAALDPVLRAEPDRAEVCALSPGSHGRGNAAAHGAADGRNA